MSRSKGLLFALVMVLFLLEGTVLKWIIPSVWQGNVAVSTHFTLVVIMFIGLYYNRHLSLFYGLGFGLLHDIVYYGPTMIGAYSFSMGVIGYVCGLASSRSRPNILFSMFIITMGNFLFEGILYSLYRLFQVTKDTPQWMFFHIMLPSVLINLLFALLIYVPLRKWLEDMVSQKPKED
ncbi:rod shape-determining protein MreD [Paenibacillus sp. YN15]|uniref:rod shape-determining protein MreD n=1 Tax=Paenibacillus sp. YN15 TaxID=1742774 RepID=UPI000DCED16C|nr:rod shape-determining protein MreD [Paenibacillus sp. YN15]RAV01208.1 rod shape-determining protein MreD [Paenibacillus sp. YN15]